MHAPLTYAQVSEWLSRLGVVLVIRWSRVRFLSSAILFCFFSYLALRDKKLNTMEEKEFLDFPDGDAGGDVEWDADDEVEEDGRATMPLPDKRIKFSGGVFVDEDTVRRASKYAKESVSGKSRSRSSVSKSFRFLKTSNDFTTMNNFIKHGVVKSNRLASLQEISQLLLQKVTEKLDEGIVLHDRDLRVLAVGINRELPEPVEGFVASRSWVTRWKQSHRIGSRHVTRFVSKKTLVDMDKVRKEGEEFFKRVRDDE